jgi:Amino acid permease
MAAARKVTEMIFGAPLDPFSKETRRHVVLVAFLAWIGLGADGLSSSCYGPEEAFLALGENRHLGLYLAAATAATVFIIAVAYNQVIELFPSGGGGYKVATSLIGPYAGLVSGAALIVDYMLTISISIASGVDAVFSFLPRSIQFIKLEAEIALVLLLLVLNLRGMRESIKVLLPIFLGFFITHAIIIFLGIGMHADRIPDLIPNTLNQTNQLTQQMGWIFVASLFLRAYSLGGGTYTGIEAVSNNVQSLAEPRVLTGKWTMFYMAVSLSFIAGGIILLYLLWNVQPVDGETLNAVTFRAILQDAIGSSVIESPILWLLLALEGGLLFVAANTGYLGGPAVLANMATDSWVPHQYRYLSSRLVTQRGIVLMGMAAVGILIATGGSVSLLVVLYSINVFLTFSLSLLGLCIYWWGGEESTAAGSCGLLSRSSAWR